MNQLEQIDYKDMNATEAFAFTTICTVLSVISASYMKSFCVVLDYILIDFLYGCAKLVPFFSLYLAHSGKINRNIAKVYKWVKRKAGMK